MKNVDKLAQAFYENRKVCTEPIEFNVGEECYVIDPNIIDNETGTAAFIPCIVVRVDISNRIPGRKYYMFQAKDSINDEQLNSKAENGVRFYEYLENTSPRLFKVGTVIG